MQQIFPVESKILGFRIRNRVQVPQSKNAESSAYNPESKTWNPESKTVLKFLSWGCEIIAFTLYIDPISLIW